MDQILAYPYCGSMAEKELLVKWLTEKNHCPVCRRRITIEEYPVVKLN